MIKQFTQAGARLQPSVGLQFAARRNHAAYDAAQCRCGIDFIKAQCSKLLIQLQLPDRMQRQRFPADAAGLMGFDMINVDPVIIRLGCRYRDGLSQFRDDEVAIAFGDRLQKLTDIIRQMKQLGLTRR